MLFLECKVFVNSSSWLNKPCGSPYEINGSMSTMDMFKSGHIKNSKDTEDLKLYHYYQAIS